ncbi:Pr6Pr family membrane protein [Gulosibacter sediminis]|uniref:Pr6Pr family membrane protein n=1 Tax=Gulosibacter sediminis TaxID=1729695 RepID=UPI0018683812|nr:Pr6Pr family membrane protein [Gulosibacter sediminis]
MARTTTLPAVNRYARTNRAVHPDRAWVRILRLALGLAALAGVAWNFYRAANGMVESTLIESMSQFTNISNLLFGIVLIVGALRARASLPLWWDDLRGAAAFYMVMTGLIYAILVAAPGELARWDLEWSNILLHRITPMLGFVGWLVITQTRRASWGRPLAWLAYPLLYLVYTWVRGGIVGWYPYAFLDPTGPGGWGSVIATSAQVFVAFLAVAVVLHVLGLLRVRLASRPTARARAE